MTSPQNKINGSYIVCVLVWSRTQCVLQAGIQLIFSHVRLPSAELTAAKLVFWSVCLSVCSFPLKHGIISPVIGSILETPENKPVNHS